MMMSFSLYSRSAEQISFDREKITEASILHISQFSQQIIPAADSMIVSKLKTAVSLGTRNPTIVTPWCKGP